MSQTTLPSPPPAAADPGRQPPRRRLWRLMALVVAVPLLAGGVGLWWFVLRGDAPASVDLGQAVAGIDAGSGSTGGVIQGTWTVDTSITNAQGTGSFGGFRIDEVLATIGATTAVGRSPAVQGAGTVNGTTVTAADITIDLTAITSDESRRNAPIQRALGTSSYPDATFVLTKPIDVGPIDVGTAITVAATGDLTIHGITRSVTFDLNAQLQGGVLVVVGSAPVTLSDYGITAPTAPIVASVADHATIELQLYLRQS